MLKKILVPLDGSKLAEQALPYAEELAQNIGAEIILLRVFEPAIPLKYKAFAFDTYEKAEVHFRQQVKEYLQKIQAKLQEKRIKVEMMIVNHQPPAENILDIVTQNEIDLVIMSTHGHSEATRWIYGSVADKVLQSVSCPVMLIRVDHS